MAKPIKFTICMFFFIIALAFSTSARILSQEGPQSAVIANPGLPSVSVPQVGTNQAQPSGQVPAVAVPDDDQDADSPLPPPEEVDDTQPNAVAPVVGPTATPGSGVTATPVVPPPEDVDDTEPNTVAPVVGPTATPGSGVTAIPVVPTTATPGSGVTATPVVPTTTTVAQPGTQTPPLSFFMHDVLGGLHPSARVVTGIIANSMANGIPFSQLNNNVFPVQGGVPLINGNINNIINNNNNIPFLAGFNGPQTNTILQNGGNNNVVSGNNNQPFVTAGQLPSGATLQQLMFGSLTVIDDELTEGHELGSAVIGEGQGFYLASSLDGTSQTIALTVLLHGDDHSNHEVEDTISMFGVHRTASIKSQVAVVGGTGKYENAKGYALVETLYNQEDQHTTDGVDTIVHFSIYLSE